MSNYYYAVLTMAFSCGIMHGMNKQIIPSNQPKESIIAKFNSHHKVFAAIVQKDNPATKIALCSLLNISPETIKKIDYEHLAKFDSNGSLTKAIELNRSALKDLKKAASEVDVSNVEFTHKLEANAFSERLKGAGVGVFHLIAAGMLFRVTFKEVMRPFAESETFTSIYYRNMFPLFSRSCLNIFAWDKEIFRGCGLIAASAYASSYLKNGLLNLYKAMFFKHYCSQQKATTTANLDALKQVKRFAKTKNEMFKKSENEKKVKNKEEVR